MKMAHIIDNIGRIREEIPAHVKLEAAAKTRSADEIKAAVEGGVDILGYNYVQEGISISNELKETCGTDFSGSVEYHLIGPLQKNKINKALTLYTTIETVSSLEQAEEINKRASLQVDLFLQVNIGEEDSKSGISPGETVSAAESIGRLEMVKLKGLMTIEPFKENPEDSRSYFNQMRAFFNECNNMTNDLFKHLSMGMSHNYRVACEEGATIIRIGTGIFGPRS